MGATEHATSAGRADEATDAEATARKRSYRREFGSTLLLSLATVASTWCAYQSSLWNGRQATAFSEAGTARTKAEGKASAARQETAFDAGMFIQFLTAQSEGKQRLATFLYRRFRPEAKVAVDAWLATGPFENPEGSPPSPFAMRQYAQADARTAEQLGELADQKFKEARQANQTSDRYVMLTVLFTSVMFFAGVGSKTSSPAMTRALLWLGVAVFGVATVALFVFPALRAGG